MSNVLPTAAPTAMALSRLPVESASFAADAAAINATAPSAFSTFAWRLNILVSRATGYISFNHKSYDGSTVALNVL